MNHNNNNKRQTSTVGHYGSSYLGVGLVELDKYRDKGNDDDDNLVRNVVAAFRSGSTVFKEAVDAEKRTIKTVQDITGTQILKFQNVKGVIKSGGELVQNMNKIDFCSKNNVLHIQATIVSNLTNEKLLVPTSMNKELPLNIKFWEDDIAWLDRWSKRTKNTDDLDEYCSYNEHANTASYQDFPDVKLLAKSLKMDAKELSELPNNIRSQIARKMTFSRGKTSRLTRFVIGAMYHMCLEMKGGDTDINLAIRPALDGIEPYEPNMLAAYCGRDDLAYVSCDMPGNQNYMGFQYIISREFPFNGALPILTNIYDGREMFSLCMMNEISEEAPGIGIMCDGTPTWRGNNAAFTYNASNWHSYMLNYARAIGCENCLDEAYAIAAVLMQPHKLSNVSLPRRRSAGELFMRSASTKNVDGLVPNRGQIKELLLGAYCVASACLVSYKEIVSHDKLTSRGGDVDRTVFTDILRGRQVRNQWYRFLNDNGMSECVAIMERIDFLDFGVAEPHLRYLDNEIVTPHWVVSPYSSNKAIRHGMMQSIRRWPYETRAKLNTQIPANRAKTMGMMRQLGCLNGDATKAELALRRPGYIAADCSVLERWLHPGNVSTVKGGIKVATVKYRGRLKRKLEKYVPPTEFEGDSDGIVWDDTSEASSVDSDSDYSKLSDEDDDEDSYSSSPKRPREVLKGGILKPTSERKWKVKYKINDDAISDLQSMRENASVASSISVGAGKETNSVQERGKEVKTEEWEKEDNEHVVGSDKESKIGSINEEWYVSYMKEVPEMATLKLLDKDLHDLTKGSTLDEDVLRSIIYENESRIDVGTLGDEPSRYEYDHTLIEQEMKIAEEAYRDRKLENTAIIKLLSNKRIDKAVNASASASLSTCHSVASGDRSKVGSKSRKIMQVIERKIKEESTSKTGSLNTYDGAWINTIAKCVMEMSFMDGEFEIKDKSGILTTWKRLSGGNWSIQRRNAIINQIALCKDHKAGVFRDIADDAGTSPEIAHRIVTSPTFIRIITGKGYLGVRSSSLRVSAEAADLFRNLVKSVSPKAKCKVKGDDSSGAGHGPIIGVDIQALIGWLEKSSNTDREELDKDSYVIRQEREFVNMLNRLAKSSRFSK